MLNIIRSNRLRPLINKDFCYCNSLEFPDIIKELDIETYLQDQLQVLDTTLVRLQRPRR